MVRAITATSIAPQNYDDHVRAASPLLAQTGRRHPPRTALFLSRPPNYLKGDSTATALSCYGGGTLYWIAGVVLSFPRIPYLEMTYKGLSR